MRNPTFKLFGALLLTLLVAPIVAPAARAQDEAQAQPTLKVGDVGPEIQVIGWWKDKAPAPREKGRVYVIDFWASWCPPCRESMPHMMEMQDKYGDYATFIGISIDDRPGDAAQYLSALGDDLPIYFAVDKKGWSWDTWGHAAGRDTIPTTFVLDEKGKISWIGHPMDSDMEKTLRKLLIK